MVVRNLLNSLTDEDKIVIYDIANYTRYILDGANDELLEKHPEIDKAVINFVYFNFVTGFVEVYVDKEPDKMYDRKYRTFFPERKQFNRFGNLYKEMKRRKI